MNSKTVLKFGSNGGTNKYVYTKDSVYLTEDQRQFYEDNGFLVIKNLVDWKLLDECKQKFTDFCNNNSPTVNVSFLMKDKYLKNQNIKGEYSVNKIQDYLFDDVFFKYASNKIMVDIVQSIIGPNITACSSMIVNKPPNSTDDFSRHPLHQDLLYFSFRPANGIVGVWTAMEKVHEKNGCLFVIPGSHKGSLYKHDYPLVAFHEAIGMDHIPTVNIIMEKGDTIFFHPLLLHGSRPNHTQGFRKAISCHYADSTSRFINIKGTTQEIIIKDLVDIMNARGYGSISINTFFKLKSRLIRGEPGSFQNMDSHL
ncbi:hypothetical protein FQA39_LY03107 [Lamprigera yunnana]|nr:hypothetical protein FQA39_LY03107 [Lamprigera yunnana]